jgi:hypothetical protein
MSHSFTVIKFLLYVNEILFWEKKRHSKAVKTVLGTSQVLLLIKFFDRDDLKPEKPNGHQTALKV